MNDLNDKQLDALEKLAINASTIVLGTFIVAGGFLSSKGFQLTHFTVGIIIYTGLMWGILKINSDERRKKP